MDYADLKSRLRHVLVTDPSPETTPAARKEAERAAEEAPRREDRAAFCWILAQHCANHAEFDASEKWIDEARRLSAGIPLLEANTAYIYATMLNRQRKGVEAIAVLAPFLQSEIKESDMSLAARMYTLLAGLYDSVGDVELAEQTFQTALELREKQGDLNGLAVVNYNYAEFCARQDDEGRALEHFVRAYEIEKELGHDGALAQSAVQIALLFAKQGLRDDALKYYQEAVDASLRSGVPIVIAFVKANGASVYERLGDETARLTSLLDAKTYLDRYPFDNIRGEVLGNLGSMYAKRKDFDRAEPLLKKALSISESQNHPYAVGHWLSVYGEMLSEQGRHEEAIPILERAVQISSGVKAHVNTLRSFSELARAHAALGHSSESARMLSEWASTYVQEHNADVEQRLRAMQRQRERERKAQEAEIYRLKNVELSTAMTKLEKVNTELRELAVEKDEFMAIAAHDLRNPLADMRGMLLTMISHFDVLGKDDVLDICKDLLATTTRMSATVHAFLEISRTDRRSSGITTERLDLVHLAHRAVERHGSRAESKQMKIRIDTAESSLFANGDASIVEAVLDNLLSNAIKYAPAETEVVIKVKNLQNESMICVCDQGPGVPKSEQPKLFTKYARLAISEGKEDSLGLGLYLAKRMAERMNGRLVYEDRPEGGACFALYIQQTPA